MEMVLGVSMTPTSIRMVLVEGEKADGVIVEQDVFDITDMDISATSSASDQVIDAILGTQEGARVAGHHLVSTGVTWSDQAEAAALRAALESRGIEDVMLVSELYAAAALAQAVGRAVDYEQTALVFVERDTATLAVVETTDGSVMKLLSQSLHGANAIAVLTDMVAKLEAQKALPEGIFVVGSGADVTSIKSSLQDMLSVPVVAPLEPQLAMPRGAALASANAPRFDTSTIGLAYSQDPGDTVLHPIALADDATEFLGRNDASTDADPAFVLDDMRAGRGAFVLVGSTLAAVFAVGVAVLAVTMAVNLQSTAQRAADTATVPPAGVPPPSAALSPQPVLPQPAHTRVPDPAAAAPSAATVTTAQLMVPPAPRIVVHNVAPAPAVHAPVAAAPAAPVLPPPAAPPPVIQAPLIPWLPPILQPPPPLVWYPVPGPPWGHGGHNGHGGDDDEGD